MKARTLIVWRETSLRPTALGFGRATTAGPLRVPIGLRVRFTPKTHTPDGRRAMPEYGVAEVLGGQGWLGPKRLWMSSVNLYAGLLPARCSSCGALARHAWVGDTKLCRQCYRSAVARLT